MILILLLAWIQSIQPYQTSTTIHPSDMVYDDGEPWVTTHPPDPEIDPERRVLWKHLVDSDYKCNEPKASSCSWVHVNMNILLHQDWFYIPEEPFSKLKFTKSATWDLDGHYLTEFEYDGQFAKIIHAYFTVVYNDQRLFGNIECNGYKYTISSSSSNIAALKRWQNRWNETLESGSRNTVLREAFPLDPPKQEPMDGFPFFYDAIKWVYQTKNWGDEYKYLVLKGLEGPSYKPVNVSVTVLFSPEVFYGAGLNNRYLVQMIAGYAIQQLQFACENSQIPITFHLHCIQYVPKFHPKTGRSMLDLNPAQYLEYFNSDEFGDQKMGADLLLVIRDHIGDRSSVSVFNGLYYKKTAMVISQDFIFDRYIYAHELGHILGCGHEEGATPALKPSMFFAYSHIMVNGQCDLMSSPINRKCIQGLFYSNPHVKIDSVETGTYKANNALWITNNRYALAKIGNESFVCQDSDIFTSVKIQQIWGLSENNSHIFFEKNVPRWSGK